MAEGCFISSFPQPSVDDVLKMDLVELMELCEKMGIASDEFMSDSEFQSAILDHMIATRKTSLQFRSSFSPFAQAASAFARDVEMKRSRFVDVMNVVEKLLGEETVRPWLEKLNAHKIPRWMNQQQFNRKKESVGGNPVLLIAGGTSAGKSTLVNALLGEALLPTSHNASTSVLCEIKSSRSAGTKHAIMHFERGKDVMTEEVDLMTSEGRSHFAKCIVGSRTRTTSAPSLSSHFSCVRAEIFWPVEFLKNFTVVDSPGVTEGEGDSVSRQITEQFQRDFACGFIYVLDATRAVEEAAQVGGLLRAVVKATNNLPPPGSALFVVNKWDLLIQQLSAAEQEEFLARMSECLAARWPGFDADKQLLTMNAKLALQVQELGSTTSDLCNLCDGIMSVLPSGMDYMLLRALSHPVGLLNEVEQITDIAIRTLTMPAVERAKKLDSDWLQLESFKRSQETGMLAKLTMKIHDRIDELVVNLNHHLRSEQGKKFVLQAKNSELTEMAEEWFAIADIRATVERGFVDAVCQYEGYSNLCKWVQREMLHGARELLTQLIMVKGEVGASIVRRSSCMSLNVYENEDQEVRQSLLLRSLALALMVLPINWPGLLMTLGKMIFTKTDDASTSSQTKAFLKSNWIVRKLHKSIYWRTVEQAYHAVVDKACENNAAMLRQVITNNLVNNVEVVQVVLQELPDSIQAIEQEIIGRSKQKESDIESFCLALNEIRRVRSIACQNVVVLKSPTFKKEEIHFTVPRVPIACGTYGQVYKAAMRHHQVIAVEDMETVVSGENSDELYFLISIAMQLSHRNLRKFFGTIAMSEEPLQLGLLLEWCGDMTLAAVVFDQGILTQSKKLQLSLQILNCLIYLHGIGLVHRGLFPEQIMVIPDLVVKLGCVSSGWAHKKVTEISRIVHTAPEILLGYPFGISADMFSFGVLLWEIWHGMPANWCNSTMRVDEWAAQLVQQLPIVLSAEGRSHIEATWTAVWEKCWLPTPEDRLSASSAYDTMTKLNK